MTSALATEVGGFRMATVWWAGRLIAFAYACTYY
jgi:hypothetical protein